MPSNFPQQPWSRSRELLNACMSGSWSEVSALLAAGANLLSSDEEGRNILHYACMGDNTEVVKNILKENIEETRHMICEKSKRFETPLGIACKEGYTSLVLLFVDRDPNQVGMLALHRACKDGQDAFVKCLLQRNLDINAEDFTTKDSPLHVAISNGCAEVVNTLLEKNADVNHRNRCGYTPLHRAILTNNPCILGKILQKDPDINAADTNGDTPLHLACIINSEHIVLMLLNHQAILCFENTNGFTPLHIACMKGFTDIVEILVTAGATINYTKRNVKSPLYLASVGGHGDVVRFLLDHGADVAQGCNSVDGAFHGKRWKVLKQILSHMKRLPEEVRNQLTSNIQLPQEMLLE